MTPDPNRFALTDVDIDFVLEETIQDARNRERLRQLIQDDDDFRKAMIGDDRVFQRVMSDDEAFLKISPSLYFEVLLRRARKDLSIATHTIEYSGRRDVPVFDTQEVTEFMGRPGVLEYLGHMLASFTRIQSYVVPIRVRRGVRRRIKYSDMDIDSLLRRCSTTEEPYRFSYYKRIADVCLFISGIFQDHAGGSSSVRPGRTRRSMEDYEREGRRFYGLAQKHPTAQALSLSDVFGLLRQHFVAARKPISFIASQYLHSRKHHMFSV